MLKCYCGESNLMRLGLVICMNPSSEALGQRTQSRLTSIVQVPSLLLQLVEPRWTSVSQQLPLPGAWRWISVSLRLSRLPLVAEASSCSIPCLPTFVSHKAAFKRIHNMLNNDNEAGRSQHATQCLNLHGSSLTSNTSYHKRSLANASPTLFKSQTTTLPSRPAHKFHQINVKCCRFNSNEVPETFRKQMQVMTSQYLMCWTT